MRKDKVFVYTVKVLDIGGGNKDGKIKKRNSDNKSI